MTEKIVLIKKFLKGQMSQEEEGVFKTMLKTDARLRSLAFIVTFMLKAQNSW